MKRALLGLCLLVPSPAHAHGCGGGGGGGGHGGGGGGGGHSCSEVSTVVGRQHCAQFGQWSMLARLPAIEFDTELFHEHFLLAPTSATGSVEHFGMPYAYRVVATNGAASAWGLRERTAWKVAGPIYMGIELDIGGLSSGPAMQAELSNTSGPTIGEPTAMFAAGRAVVGARAFVTPTVSISAEVAGGGRMISMMVTSQLLDCTQQTSVSSGTGVLEARGRLDWWATPHLTFGASIGTSLIDADDRTYTLGISGHIRAYDATY